MMNLLKNCPFCNHTLKNLHDNLTTSEKIIGKYNDSFIGCLYDDCKFENLTRFMQSKFNPNILCCLLEIKNIIYEIRTQSLRSIHIEITNCDTYEVLNASIKKLEFNSIKDLEITVRKTLLNVFE